ncbi:polysaccharide pyruvyl transferase family protein [Agromyces indicus]
MLLTVGSVLHFGRPEAHVWGTGRNGKVESEPVPGMYIHALRGPLTARYLSSRYTTLPDTYGDPGLLVPYLFPEFTRPESPSRKIGVLANLNDKREPGDTFSVIEPTAPVDQVVRAILDCEYLVTSSLHGLIIAESFGVPVRHMRSDHEPRFKYEDYFEGTGRRMPPSAHNPMHALDLGPQDPVTFDPEPLLAAFPRHLWSRTASSKSNSKRGAAA